MKDSLDKGGYQMAASGVALCSILSMLRILRLSAEEFAISYSTYRGEGEKESEREGERGSVRNSALTCVEYNIVYTAQVPSCRIVISLLQFLLMFCLQLMSVV